jgi:hypothetical protein
VTDVPVSAAGCGGLFGAPLARHALGHPLVALDQVLRGSLVD